MRSRVLSACLFVGVAAAFLWLAAAAPSADWPQWRGPNRDGVVHGVKVPEKWPKALKEEWKVPVGEGISSPVVVGDRAFVFARHKDDELVLCRARAGGTGVWNAGACRSADRVWAR